MRSHLRNGREIVVPPSNEVLEGQSGWAEEVVRPVSGGPLARPVQRGEITVRHEWVEPPPVYGPLPPERPLVPVWLKLVAYLVAVVFAMFAAITVAAGPPWAHDAAKQKSVPAHSRSSR